jgi:hypothetical protein
LIACEAKKALTQEATHTNSPNRWFTMASSRPVYVPSKRRQASTAAALAPQRSATTRQQPPARFHGAFTGGFSAGYFNTVGSKEGWAPQNDIGRREAQRLEDFMDEQDHEEWGGPTAVRQEYGSRKTMASSTTLSAEDTAEANTTSSTSLVVVKEPRQSGGSASPPPPASLLSLDRMFQVSHQTVGPRLLRRLGWREEGSGSAAYVKEDVVIPQSSTGGRNAGNKSDTQEEEELSHLLSSKRLRKIQLQQTRMKLPPPKLDPCGLGFDAYADAPEFQRYRERRKQLAHDRAHGSNAFGRNAYHTSRLVAASGGERPGGGRNDKNEGDVGTTDPYVAYETVEDFVGKKSVGGFAMRDDEDDAYDDDDNDQGHERIVLALTSNGKGNDTKKRAVQGLSNSQYNTEIYEHVSSDDEVEGSHHHRHTSKPSGGRSSNKTDDFGGILAAWADTSTSTKNIEGVPGQSRTTSRGLMTSGRPPPPGFVLGGAVQSHVQRFPGPDITLDYQLERHVFGVNEHPLVFQTLSRAVQLELQGERDQQQMQQAREDAVREKERQFKQQAAASVTKTVNESKSSTAPMAGGRFSGLAAAMKSRFTTGEHKSGRNGMGQEKDVKSPSPPRIGLQIMPRQEKAATIFIESGTVTTTTNAPVLPPEHKEIKLTRTVQLFSPHPLLCNRLHVPVPKHAVSGSVSLATSNKGVRMTEAAYFEKEILAGAPGSATGDVSQQSKPTIVKPTATTTKTRNLVAAVTGIASTGGVTDNNIDDADVEDEPKLMPRAPIDTLKSIFAPESESESSEDEHETVAELLADNPAKDVDDAQETIVAQTLESQTTTSDSLPPSGVPTHDQLVVYEKKHQGSEGSKSEDDQARDEGWSSRHDKKRHRRPSRSKHSRSTESSEDINESGSDNLSSSESRRHHKRRKKEHRRERKRNDKKKKKKKTSSKRERH